MSPQVQIQFPDRMEARLAAVYADISEQRLRILVREGRLKAETVEGHMTFTKANLDAYLANRGATRKGGGPRADGKSFVIKVKPADLQAVKDALSKLGIELQPRYNYAKQAEYRKKRLAEAAASKTAKVPTPTTSTPK